MGKFIGKPAVLRELNSAQIEGLLHEYGAMTKPELAQRTGLSLPTVNNLVKDMLSEDIIACVGSSGNGPGRRAALYEINRKTGCLVALYYQRGKFRARVADITGQTIRETTLPLISGDTQQTLESAIRAIDLLIDSAPHPVKAIGLGVPGAVMPDGSLVGIPKVKSWEGFNLASALTARYDVGIIVENDVKLSAVGYYHARMGRRPDHIVYIYVGDGVGAGIIINGRLYNGRSNFSGEIGFMAPLEGQWPARDFKREGGYLESRMSALNAEVAEERRALVCMLGSIAANHVAVLNPDAIVFGGEAVSEDMISEIRQLMTSYTPDASMPQILYDGSDAAGIEGLIQACRGALTARVQLVQNGGI